MSISILKASDPVSIESLILLIYGEPGSGKTSLGQTATDPLTLDFDRGAHRSAFRKDTVPIDSWKDVESLGEADLKPYATIEVDTVGRCLDFMSLSIVERNPKMGTPAGGLTLQGYGALKAEFAAWMRKLRSFGKDVVLVAHGDEKSSGDVVILRPEITGSSYGEVFKQADGVGYLRMVDRKRILEWDPQERSVGKNPAGLPRTEVPHLAQEPDFLAKIMQEIKDSINKLSEEGQRVVAVVSEWQERIAEAAKPADLTKLVEAVNEDLEGPAQRQVKALIAERAKELELAWDKKAKSFKKAA